MDHTHPLCAEALHALSLPLLVLDDAAQIVWANAAFRAFSGLGARRWIGQPCSTLGLDVDIQRALDQARTTQQTQRLETVHFQESEAQLLIQALPGAPGGWLLEWHVLGAFPGIETATALPNALAATLKGLAHEVRNPLAGLRGAAQLLARRVPDGDARRYIDVIEAETTRLADLVERLLDPHPTRPFAPLNIHDVLERVRALAETDAGWSARITRDYDPSLPLISGDRDRLIQAVLNLVRNALQAGANEVRLRSRAEHGVLIAERMHRLALRVDVIDDGAGISEALAPRVFLPLVSGRAEGSGLGLALAQEIAREHGGGLGFVSRPGHTVFTLLLPCGADLGDNAA